MYEVRSTEYIVRSIYEHVLLLYSVPCTRKKKKSRTTNQTDKKLLILVPGINNHPTVFSAQTFTLTIYVYEAHLCFHGEAAAAGPWDTKVVVSLPNDPMGERHETSRAGKTPNPVWDQVRYARCLQQYQPPILLFFFPFFSSSGGWVKIKLTLPHFHVSDTAACELIQRL